MEKEVLIHVRGLQFMEEAGEEPIEIVVPGEHYVRGGSHYLRYEEILEDFGEPTVNYIKMSGEGLEVRKKGVINVHMVFEPGKKNMTYYSTPFGTLQLGIAATSLAFQDGEDGICMKADYALDINEEHVADCCLTIQAQSKSAGNFVL